MLNGRKTIGIILFDITGYYQQQLVHTLSKNASKRGYNLLTFSAFTIYGSDTKNAAGEYNILHLIPYEQLDALIVLIPSVSLSSGIAMMPSRNCGNLSQNAVRHPLSAYAKK